MVLFVIGMILALAMIPVLIVMQLDKENQSTAPTPTPTPTHDEPEPVQTAAVPEKVAYQDTTAVKLALAKLQTSYRKCIQKALDAKAKLDGKVEIVVSVKPDGHVSDTKATGDLPETVTACIRKEIAAATFPPPETGEPETLKIPVSVTSK